MVFSSATRTTCRRRQHLIPATNDIVREFADMLATIAQAFGGQYDHEG
jgi:hypothetical protein